MVQHAHRKNGIKGVQRRKLFNSQRQQMRPLVVAQQFTYGFKLAKEQLGGIDAYRQMSAGANHPPHVISAAAADIKNSPSGQVGKVWQYALPLPVGTPLGIDIHAVKGEGPFTPWHQILQQVFNAQALAFTERRFALSSDAMQQVEAVGRKLGQKLDGPFPLPVFAVQRFTLPGRDLSG